MENIQDNQQVMEKVSLDNLLRALAHAKAEKTRLTRYHVDEIFHLILSEIPYAFQIIPRVLAESLLDNSPQKSTDLSLNSVVVNLGSSIFNPAQKESLGESIKVYLQASKKTEKAYAITLLDSIIHQDILTPFPESAHTALSGLAQTIIENIIHEKQLRKVPYYVPRPLTDIIRPIIYSKLYNLELDKVKFSHRAAFRKYVSTITYESYDLVQDYSLIAQITQEKENAYQIFKDAVAKKVPTEEKLIHFQHLHKFEQFDRNRKTQTLNKMLDEFLKPGNIKTPLGFISYHLRIRFKDKLQKLLFSTDINSDIYLDDATIKEMHDKEFAEVEYDVNVIKTLMAEVLAIQINFKKNFLHMFTGANEFALIEDGLVNALLGISAVRTDPITGKKIGVRDGGYLKASFSTIYSNMAGRLKVISNQVKGLFGEKLKAAMDVCILNIRHAQEKLVGYSPADVYLPEEEVEELKIEGATSEELTKKIASEETIARSAADTVVPKPLIIEDRFDDVLAPETPTEKVTPKPLIIQDNFDDVLETPTEKVTPPLLIIEDNFDDVSASETPTEKVTPPLLIIEDNFDDVSASETPTEKVTPPLLIIEDNFDDVSASETPTEKVTPRPLIIGDNFDDVSTSETPTEKVTPPPLIIEDNFDDVSTSETPTEKVTPPPLIIEDNFDDVSTSEMPTEKVTPPPLIIEDNFDDVSTSEMPTEKVTPPPLIIEDNFGDVSTSETPTKKVIPQPSIIEDNFDDVSTSEMPTEKVTPQPLIIEGNFDDVLAPEIPPEKVTPKPLIIEDPFNDEISAKETSSEKVIAKPLELDIDFESDAFAFDEPTIKTQPEPFISTEVDMNPVAAIRSSIIQPSLDAGTEIMSNYQLGDLHQSVSGAWEKMMKHSDAMNGGLDSLSLSSDHEVRLYVICDLIQQVTSVNESNLSASKKQIFQDMKHKLMDALEDPLDENNWSFFEGVRRDNIDRNLASLGE